MDQPHASLLTALNDDVLLLICAALQQLTLKIQTSRDSLTTTVYLKVLSLTCKRLRALCIPQLFESITLCCGPESTWADALARLEAWDPAIGRYARAVTITLLSRSKEELPFPVSLPAKLANFLQSIASSSLRLDSLTFLIDTDRTPLFAAEFARRRLVFPGVRRLTLGPANEVLIAHFPDTHTLSGRRYEWLTNAKEPSHALVRAAAGLERLECLVLREHWDPRLMDAVQDVLPRLKILVMAPPSTLHRDLPLETLVAYLSRFPALAILSVPPSAVLLAGFTLSHSGLLTRDNVQKRRAEAEERIARAVFEQCAQMREVWFGRSRRATLGLEAEAEGGRRKLVWDSKVPVWLQR
ncbi:hypothetical protein BDW22DRAFT_11280 [Trametopsis cervina]|nr:hypothetical protein BDW22DRAFT_11280 [Trametopsis cervina]